MGFHRQIDQRVYGDQRFRRLSPPPPSGQSLWIYLLTGPHHVGLPGLFITGEMGLAEALGWPLGGGGTLFDSTVHGFRECWEELEGEGMAVADWAARVVYLPRTWKQHEVNRPRNPNILNYWRDLWDAVPESPLKWTWLESLYLELPVLVGDCKPFESRMLQLWPSLASPIPERVAENIGERITENLPPIIAEIGKGKGKGKGNGNGISRSKVAAEPQPLPRDDEKLAEYHSWIDELERAAAAEGVPAGTVRMYVEEAHAGLSAFYEARGGRATATRLAFVSRAMRGLSMEIQLAALELFGDGHSGSKDERYLVGIARRLGRDTEAERVAQMDRHRRQQRGRGLFARTQGSAMGGSHG